MNTNFREIPKPEKTCGTCDNKTYHMEQGWSRCTYTPDRLILWSKMDWLVCDAWTAKKQLSEKEKVLAKLSKEDRRILGI